MDGAYGSLRAFYKTFQHDWISDKLSQYLSSLQRKLDFDGGVRWKHNKTNHRQQRKHEWSQQQTHQTLQKQTAVFSRSMTLDFLSTFTCKMCICTKLKSHAASLFKVVSEMYSIVQKMKRCDAPPLLDHQRVLHTFCQVKQRRAEEEPLADWIIVWWSNKGVGGVL